MVKLGIFADIPDVTDHATFHLLLMNLMRASLGSKRGFAFEMHMALTTLPCVDK
jgi:hypothetical protein